MKKFVKNTLTGLAIGAKSLVPGGDAMGQGGFEPNLMYSKEQAPNISYEAMAEFKLTNLIKLGRFGNIYANAGALYIPTRAKGIYTKYDFETGDERTGEGLTPLATTFFGAGININLGKLTKLDMGLGLRVNENGYAGDKTIIKLQHNLERFGMPNINAYVKYKNATLMAHAPEYMFSFWRRGFGLGAEYEKQITDNLKFNVSAGLSHNTFKFGGSERHIIKDSPLKFHTDIGLHYKIPPIKFGRLTLGSEIEPTPPPTSKPKAQKSTSQKRKVSNTVPCYAYPQQRGSESKIFNRP